MNPLEIPAEKRARASALERVLARFGDAVACAVAALARVMCSTPFAVVFGLITPLVCIACDPFLFRTRDSTTPFTMAAPFGYAFIVIQLVALSYWLWRRKANTWLAGILAAGAMFAGFAVVPVLTLFLAMWGTFGELIDDVRALATLALGASIALTFLVYLRAASLVARAMASHPTSGRSAPYAVLAFVLAWTLPAAPQLAVIVEIDRAKHAFYEARSPESEQHAVARVRRAQLVYSPTQLIREYHGERDPARKQRIARLFEALTGATMPEDDSAWYGY